MGSLPVIRVPIGGVAEDARCETGSYNNGGRSIGGGVLGFLEESGDQTIVKCLSG